MKTDRASLLMIVTSAALSSCADVAPVQVCPAPTEFAAHSIQLGGLEGADLLFVIDDSVSMAEEREILATSLFPLVNSLVNPIHTGFQETNWPYPAVDELRVAVVTSNMGLSSNGESNDDLWPGGEAPAGCHDLGDEGRFQGIEVSGIALQNDVIPCDESAEQCPIGWACDGIGAETGVGACRTHGSGEIACPGLDAPWIESDAPDPDLALRTACLAHRETKGCGIEQPLAAAAAALDRPDQADFLEYDHLLAVVVISDEDDCSIAYAAELFTEEGVALPPSKAPDFACGSDGHLVDLEEAWWRLAKPKGSWGVVFVAIVGVPWGDDEGALACQGPGYEIESCLDEDAMQIVVEQPGLGIRGHRPACTREGAAGEVARAYPARRLVELAAGHFNYMSAVRSICEPDWSPAMEDIARMIASSHGHYLRVPLEWSPATRTSECDLLVEFVNEGEACPPVFGGAEPMIEHDVDDVGDEVVRMYCQLPKLPSELECADRTAAQEAAFEAGFGWTYCENLHAEDFIDACSDAVDNDEDGDVDCDDSECADCPPCPGATGNDCSHTCMYVVDLTDAAKEAVGGRHVAVQCLRQFSNEDRNCQENTRNACSDGADNDGDGRVDCAGDARHGADPRCCPMGVGEVNVCDLEPLGVDETWDEICPAGEVSYSDGYPEACHEAAARLGCTLP